MALKMSYADKFGHLNTVAYFRIAELFVSHLREFAIIRVFVYKSKTDRDDGKDFLEKKEYVIKDNQGNENPDDDHTDFTDKFSGEMGDNHFKVAYTYIKALDEYSGAIDV